MLGKHKKAKIVLLPKKEKNYKETKTTKIQKCKFLYLRFKLKISHVAWSICPLRFFSRAYVQMISETVGHKKINFFSAAGYWWLKSNIS